MFYKRNNEIGFYLIVVLQRTPGRFRRFFSLSDPWKPESNSFGDLNFGVLQYPDT